MTAMFPASGVPAADARNSLPDAQVNSINCDELWYSTSRCQPRFDPAAANAQLAELINVVMKGEAAYDCNLLNNVELSIRRQIQRGIPKVFFTSGTNVFYDGNPDPNATRYNHGLEVVAIWHATNVGPANLNLSGLGPSPILKGNGQSVQAGDLVAGVPSILAWWNGNWYLLAAGIARSDIPIIGTIPQIMTGDIDAWVRTDGNDDTGDGTLNTPGKAFRTINGAWRKLGSLYIASPIYAINIRLGVPGEYEACQFGAYGGRVVVWGQPADPGSYVIVSQQNVGPGVGNPYSFCCHANGMASLWFHGVHFNMRGYPDGTGVMMGALSIGSVTAVGYMNCLFNVVHDNPSTAVIWIKSGGQVMYHSTNEVPNGNEFWGNNNRVANVVLCIGGKYGTASGMPTKQLFKDIRVQDVGWRATNISYVSVDGTTLNESNCTGPRWRVDNNSVMAVHGNKNELPGNADGSSGNGGLFFE
jgi:hypothetical protein